MAEKPAERGPPGGIGGLLGTVLGYLLSIDTWSRALIAVVLSTTGVLLWMIYTNPQQVFDLVRGLASHEDTDAELPYLTPLKGDIDRAMADLLAQFGPHCLGVVAFRVNLTANTAREAGAAVKPEYESTFQHAMEERWKYPIALFGDNPVVNHALGRLYVGRFHCTDQIADWPIARKFPLKELCLIAVPSEGYGLGGLIGGGWDEDIPATALATVEAAFREAAGKLTWWPKKHHS